MINFDEYPGLKTIASKIQQENKKESVIKITSKRSNKTTEGFDLINRIKKLFGDPIFFFSFRGINKEQSARVYLSSLQKTKNHNKDTLKLIEILEYIDQNDMDSILLIKDYMKRMRLLSKLKHNKDLLAKFTNGQLSIEEIERILM